MICKTRRKRWGTRGQEKREALERWLRTKSNEVFKLLAVSLEQSFLATEKHEHNPTQWAKASFCICFYIQWTFNYKLRVHPISIVLKAFLRLLQKVLDCGLTKVTLITSNITNFQWCLLASPTLKTSIFFPRNAPEWVRIQNSHTMWKYNCTISLPK